MSWSKEQCYEFIDIEPRLGRLATVSANGTPHVVPIWAKRDGDRFLVHTMAGTNKEQNIRASGTFSMVFDKHDMPYAGVVVGGTAEVVGNEVIDSLALIKELAVRFAGPEAGPGMGDYIASIPGDHVTLVLTAETFESWDHSG